MVGVEGGGERVRKRGRERKKEEGVGGGVEGEAAQGQRIERLEL